MSTVTNGISKIEFAPLLAGGLPGTVFTTFGLTSQGTPKLTQEEPKDTEYFSEESDFIEDIASQIGKSEFVFSVMCADATAMAKVLGGTVSSSTPKVWSAPRGVASIEGTIRITPRKGQIVTINRGRVRGKINHDMGKTGQLLLDVKVLVLNPPAGTDPFTYTDAA